MTTLLLLLNRHDERVLHALVLRRRVLIDHLMCTVTHLGDAVVVITVVLALMLGAAPGLEWVGAEAAFALTASHALVQLLKRIISRPRPHLPIGCTSLVEAPDRFSFPSGHAAATLSLALPLATALPLSFAVGVVVIAILVGFSRCYLGVHYPGDVLAGWLLAGVAAQVPRPALGWLG